MLDPTSRYARLTAKTLDTAGPDGEVRPIRYLERRFLPTAVESTLVEHVVASGERLDHITARYLGDPTQFWRVADANEATRPEELVEEAGRRIVITLPR